MPKLIARYDGCVRKHPEMYSVSTHQNASGKHKIKSLPSPRILLARSTMFIAKSTTMCSLARLSGSRSLTLANTTRNVGRGSMRVCFHSHHVVQRVLLQYILITIAFPSGPSFVLWPRCPHCCPRSHLGRLLQTAIENHWFASLSLTAFLPLAFCAKFSSRGL